MCALNNVYPALSMMRMRLDKCVKAGNWGITVTVFVKNHSVNQSTYQNLNILYISVQARSTVFVSLITHVNNNGFSILNAISTFV